MWRRRLFTHARRAATPAALLLRRSWQHAALGGAVCGAAAACSAAALAHCSSAAASSKPREIDDDYEFGSQLGTGTYGRVYKGTCKKTGRPVAIKALSRRKDTEEVVRAEVEALRRVALHRSICEIYDFYEAPTCFYIVMEFVDGGELLDHIIEVGTYSEPKAAAMFKEVGSALALLHAQGMCHSDIKPENLLLTKDGQVRLVDFGLACDAKRDDDVSKNRRGTWPYWAPETIEHGRMGLPADMWALGVVLFITLGGYHPFDAEGEADPKKTSHGVKTKPPDFSAPCWDKVSWQAKHLVKGLLTKDPAERLSIEQLLQHPWVVASGRPGVRRTMTTSAELTAGLRAAVFATILQQQMAAGHDQWAKSSRERSHRLRQKGTVRAEMLDAELLGRAFAAFDADAKGYITEKDLRRVLDGWGQQEADEALRSILLGGAEGDREGSRVTYGSFISLMRLLDKQHVPPDELIVRAGEHVQSFYALLSGEVVVQREGDAPPGADGTPRGTPRGTPPGTPGKPQTLNVLRAGQDCYFGESELLGKTAAATSVRCTAKDGCELLKLSKADFYAGFMRQRAPADGVSRIQRKVTGEDERRRRLLGFIQMVSPKERHCLKHGAVVPGFEEGKAADRYYILSQGTLRVSQGGVPLGDIEQGSGFGESGLLLGRKKRTKTIHCDSERGCELVSIAAPVFLRLVDKSSLIRDMITEDKDRRLADTERYLAAAEAEQPAKKPRRWLFG